MSQRTEIVAMAAREIGYKEGRNNATKYGAWYGMNNNPWCAQFVSWCAAQAGIPVTVIPKLAYVPYIYSFYNASGRYKARGSGYVPKPGDIILFGNNDHVGIVEKVANGSVVTIEGNTSGVGNSSNGDGVYRRTRALNNSWIKGYCIPDYIEEEEDMARYNTLAEVPSYAKDTVKELMAKGILKGNEKGLDLSEDMLRSLVIQMRVFEAAGIKLK